MRMNFISELHLKVLFVVTKEFAIVTIIVTKVIAVKLINFA